MAKVPADKAVSGTALPCGGGKTCQGYPLIMSEGSVPDGFTDLRQTAQIMILLHKCLIVLFLAWLNGPDNDFSEAQNGYRCYGEKIQG